MSGLNPGINVVIGIGQYFELANVISKGQFDYFITNNSDVEFLEEYDVKPVIISELPIYGYKGIEALVNAIKNSSLFYEKNRSFCYYSQPIWRLSFREVLLGASFSLA